MRREIPFNFFKKGQTIYFNITRLEELEEVIGRGQKTYLEILADIFNKRNAGINFILNSLYIGLSHHYESKDAVAEKIDKYLEKGGKLTDFIIPILDAIDKTGILPKIEKEKKESAPPDEKNAESPLVQ